MNLLKITDTINKYCLNSALAISGCGMFFMAMVSTADVITYLILGRPFPGASESVEVMLAVTVVMTIAYAQYRRNHIVVDIVVQRLPPLGKMLSDFAALIVGFFCMGLLTLCAWELALESVRIKEVAFTLYSFPIYPWKLLYAIGITLACVEFLRQLIWMVLGDRSGGAYCETKDALEGIVE